MLYREKVDDKLYYNVKYYVESSISLADACWNIAVGQSVGNPNVRNRWETDELFENSACKIIGNEEEFKKVKSGEVVIAFPLCNIDFTSDGISQLLCQVMGGQLDINTILKCHVIDIDIPAEVLARDFKTPKFGIEGVRKFTNCFNKPLLGGIIKPKIGITKEILLEMTKQLVENGVNFIKEDEIMANPNICPLEERVPFMMEYLKDKPVVYCFCINGDVDHVLERVKFIHSHGGNGVHVNFWSGFGMYRRIRDLDLPIYVHFQKSGDKILTDPSHRYHISWSVICKIATWSGVDFIHAGMIGGYSSDDETLLLKSIEILRNGQVIPALSCGMHPGLVDAIRTKIGNDWMANCGGAIHGHPGGTEAGVKAMRQAIDGTHGEEYAAAIAKWGLVDKV
jgi:ribulose 1,5-bisphosphate carboxylase large subunit-like protein